MQKSLSILLTAPRSATEFCPSSATHRRVGMEKDYRWRVRVRFPAAQDVSLFHSVQIDSGAHPASYPMSTGGRGLSPGINQQKRKANSTSI
jgi:hypothetical protein